MNWRKIHLNINKSNEDFQINELNLNEEMNVTWNRICTLRESNYAFYAVGLQP